MPDETGAARPFNEWLADVSYGDTNRELSIGLTEVTNAVIETGKPGSLTLTIKVKPAGRGGRQVVVSDVVKISKPEFDRADSIFFVATDGSLHRDNPAQGRLDLKTIAAPDGAEIREVGQ